MKKVKMLVSMAGPEESYQPGDDRTVEDAVAEEWETLGIATIVPDETVVVEQSKAKKKAKK